jgi:hypothetical protein
MLCLSKNIAALIVIIILKKAAQRGIAERSVATKAAHIFMAGYQINSF